MLRVTSNDPSTEFISFVRAWFALLANGRGAEACAQLDRPNSYGTTWTPEAIDDVLIHNFRPGSLFAAEHPEGPIVTHPDLAHGVPYADVTPRDDGSGYAVDHAVPLNGEWSDLTAQFEFLKRANGFTVVLHDLHVL